MLDDTIGHLMMAWIKDMKLPSPKKYIRTKDGVDFIPSFVYLSVVDAKLRLEMGAEKIRKRINPKLGIAGILMTCVSPGRSCARY